MRPDSWCPICKTRTKLAFLQNGTEVHLRPAAQPDGYVWIVHSTPELVTVAIAGCPAEVPSTEALRYKPHFCEPHEPSGGS